MSLKTKVVGALAFAVLIVPGISLVHAQSVADLQSEIQGLLAQLAQLQAQLLAQQGNGSFCYTFTNNISLGQSGTDVTNLQTALQKDGESITISNTFDDQTASAVSAFQEKYRGDILTPAGLSAGTGYVGSRTIAKLNALFGCGTTYISSSPSVTTSTQLSLTASDSGKTITLTTGQTFLVTLSNPGDGGYVFDNPQYDASLLQLNSHLHTSPISSTSSPVTPGNFGTDSWQFVALKPGTTDLTITAAQPWNGGGTATMFKISVNITYPSTNPPIVVAQPTVTVSSVDPQPVQVGSTLTVYFTNGGQTGSVILKTLDGTKTWHVPYTTGTVYNGFVYYDGSKVTFTVPSIIGAGQLPENSGYEAPIAITSGTYNLTVYATGCPAVSGICLGNSATSNVFPIKINTTSTQPTITGVTGPQSLTTGQAGTWGVNASDSTGDSLNYSVNWGDTASCTLGMACISSSVTTQQTATFPHTYTQAGTYTPTFTVTDIDTGKTAQTSVTVVVSSNQPIVTLSAPSAPTVTATGQTSMSVSWPAVSGATSYVVQRNPPNVDIGMANSTSFTDNWVDITYPVACGTPYQYRIEACNGNDCSSWGPWSSSVTTNACRPTITGVGAPGSPQQAIYPGAEFMVSGSNFAPPDSVYIGNEPATVTQDGTNEIVATAPSNLQSSSSSYVYVTNSNGTSNQWPVATVQLWSVPVGNPAETISSVSYPICASSANVNSRQYCKENGYVGGADGSTIGAGSCAQYTSGSTGWSVNYGSRVGARCYGPQ